MSDTLSPGTFLRKHEEIISLQVAMVTQFVSHTFKFYIIVISCLVVSGDTLLCVYYGLGKPTLAWWSIKLHLQAECMGMVTWAE